MSSGRKILIVASEYYGLVKSGGLADAVASLTKYLNTMGHETLIVVPYYAHMIPGVSSLAIPSLAVEMPMGTVRCAVRRQEVNGLAVHLIEHHQFFSRPGLYDYFGREYDDNPVRFSFFAMAALALCDELDFTPDIAHCHDWQTGMLPLYLSWRKAQGHGRFSKTKSLLTVHNGIFQGKFSAYHRGFLGLNNDSYPWNPYEDFGCINILKGGVHYADWVNTVSPNYATELQTPAGGHGLHLAFLSKDGRFSGIINGIDTNLWNPETDPYIKKNYSADDRSGKRNCTLDLLKSMGLKLIKGAPVVGLVSRLTSQKGFDYLISALYMLMYENIQFVILGEGEKHFVDQLNRLQHLNPTKVVFYHGYNEALAHKIEAGSHLFLMPSLFEPCGLNQLFSMRYGTLPIVRSVGGLKDSVKNFDYDINGESTGFVFDEPTPAAVCGTLQWAADTYRNRTGHFSKMVTRAMKADFSIEKSGRDYEILYTKIINL